MDYRDKKYFLIRSLVFLIFFIILHYSYDWFPVLQSITMYFSGINESIYQHMKMIFFSYIALFLLEYLTFKSNIEDKEKFFFAHILSTILLPLLMFVMWFIGPAVLGEFDNILLDIIYANIITYSIILFSSFLNDEFLDLQFSKEVKTIIVILFILSLVEFILFTLNLPWHDVFANPPGWD